MESNRQRVLAAVRTAASPPTVPELARQLGVAEVTVRRHLDALKAAGRVRVYGGPPPSGARALTGKPHYRYQAVGF